MKAVNTVTGGTSVSAIAAEAKMAVDMRSNSEEKLLKLEAPLLELVWYKPTNAWYGPQNALLIVLMLSGLGGVTKPALSVQKAGK